MSVIVNNYEGNFERGMYVYQSLYNTGIGVIVAVDENCNKGDCRSLAGNIGGSGGGNIDIVFENGHRSKHMPECLMRGGVQYGLSAYHFEQNITASDEEIEELIIKADQKKIDDEENERQEKERFDNEVVNLSSNPEYAHLTPISSYSATEVAKNIRKDLKHNYPGCKFSVKTERSAIRVSWCDGPTSNELQELINKFKDGKFDAYQDLHSTESTPFTTVFGGVDYVFTERNNSSAAVEQAIEAVKARNNTDGIELTVEKYEGGHLYGKFASNNDFHDLYTLINKQLNSTSLMAKANHKPVKLPGDTNKNKLVSRSDLTEVQTTKHTKTDAVIFVIAFVNRVSKEAFNETLKIAKSHKGYYSSYNKDGAIPGFIFKNKEHAETFINFFEE